MKVEWFLQKSRTGKDGQQERQVRKLEDQSRKPDTQLIEDLQREISEDEIIKEFFWDMNNINFRFKRCTEYQAQWLKRGPHRKINVIFQNRRYKKKILRVSREEERGLIHKFRNKNGMAS